MISWVRVDFSLVWYDLSIDELCRGVSDLSVDNLWRHRPPAWRSTGDLAWGVLSNDVRIALESFRNIMWQAAIRLYNHWATLIEEHRVWPCTGFSNICLRGQVLSHVLFARALLLLIRWSHEDEALRLLICEAHIFPEGNRLGCLLLAWLFGDLDCIWVKWVLLTNSVGKRNVVNRVDDLILVCLISVVLTVIVPSTIFLGRNWIPGHDFGRWFDLISEVSTKLVNLVDVFLWWSFNDLGIGRVLTSNKMDQMCGWVACNNIVFCGDHWLEISMWVINISCWPVSQFLLSLGNYITGTQLSQAVLRHDLAVRLSMGWHDSEGIRLLCRKGTCLLLTSECTVELSDSSSINVCCSVYRTS